LKSLLRIHGLAFALLFACGTTATAFNAQARDATRTKQPSKNTRAAKAGATRGRRQAVAVLLEVSNGAREIEDPYERASVLAFCADALWGADEQTARSLFRRAWEVADESDDAELKQEQQSGRDGDLPERFTRARDLALTLAAKHDARLAEGFLRRLNEWLEHHESSARDAPEVVKGGASRDIGPLNEFTQGGPRLALASSLLEEEAYKSAAALAEPTLADGVSGVLIEFLLRLRADAPDEADRLFLRLLERTRADASADANDALLLSSYVLTPRLLAVVDESGSVRFRPLADAGGAAEAPASSRRALAAFFDTAAAILLRPALPGAAATGGDTVALYFAAGRLLPFFEREAPQYAPALHARRTALAAEIEAARRDALDSQASTQRLTSENPDDPLRPRLEEIERTRDPVLRDHARLQAVREMARRQLWGRALQTAGEIEDEGTRRTARFVIAAAQVASLQDAFADAEADDFEKAATFVRNAELPPALRAYGFAQAAELAARRGRRTRAAALLEEAFGYVRQTENGTAQRDASALMTATVAARLDSPRAWEALAAAVAALNEDEEFSGDAVRFDLGSHAALSSEEQEALNEVFEPFTIDELFDAAARRNLERAVAEAHALKNELSRARALVASARAALEPNPQAQLRVTR
jgi:hypothetical protein